MSDNPSKMSPQQRASHSKRHASFNSPREVPLPSPALSQADSPFFLDQQPQSTIQPPRSPTLQPPLRPQDDRSLASVAQDSLLRQQKHQDPVDHQPEPHASPKPRGPEPRAIPSTRPAEVPDLTSAVLRQRQPPDLSSPAWLDRYSSASLPLPSQIPFHTLASQRQSSSRPAPDPSPEPASPPPADSPSPTSSAECPQLDSGNSSSSSSYSSSDGPSSSSSSSSLSKDPSRDKDPSNTPSRPESSPMESHPPPPPRPISPFRAPQPPPPQPRAPPLSEGTAMRRFMTASQLQSMAMVNSSSNYASPSSSMHSMQDTSYPPPEPPIILPVESNSFSQSLMDPRQAPYMPFLSHALLPPDTSWIEVETASTEYKLLVRLPGFSREGITLATKRRRILHIVADSWENGGGHFERKISFGYDADLAHVRAEFDGIMLRIAIPRRISPITWSGNMSRMGSSGRA